MAAFRHLITLPLAIVSFVSVFYAIAQLMLFLSLPNKIPIQYVWIANLLDDWSRLETALLPITIDAILIIVFILVHSLLRSEIIKSLWNKLGLASAERSIYNLATAAVVLLLVKKWQPIPTVTIWSINVESNNILYLAYFLIHGAAWLTIYGGSVIMDLSELTGVKQVYYDMNRLLSPMKYKSQDLNRLYQHVRHPSFLGLSTILWLPNIMSLDRLLLALLWTTYMFIGWNTDAHDVEYQRNQLRRKRIELSY